MAINMQLMIQGLYKLFGWKTLLLYLYYSVIIIFFLFISQKKSKRIKCSTTKRLDQTIGNTTQTAAKSGEEDQLRATNE